MRGVSLDDLDLVALESYLAGRSQRMLDRLGPNGFAARLGLVAPVGKELAPTVAGLYLFGELPQLSRPEWGIACVRIDGRVISAAIRGRDDLEGPAHELLAGARAFVAEQTAALVDQASGTTATEYPADVINEALVNAIVHRDMRANGRVGLYIFDDRIEVTNPGGPAVAVHLGDLAQHGGQSLPRNPLIASVARGNGWMDQVGRGLVVIRRSLSEVGGVVPSWQCTNHEVRVVIPSPHVAGGEAL